MNFPKTLYVKIVDDGSGNEYFDPHSSTDTIVDAGERATVGVYKLADMVEALGSVTIVDIKSMRKRSRGYQATYFEQRFRNRVYEAVIRALEKECAENKLKRKDLAVHMGKKESQVSRWLAGPGNWTLDTVSDLLFAIDAELDFVVTKFKNKKKKNEFHPLNSDMPPIPPLPPKLSNQGIATPPPPIQFR